MLQDEIGSMREELDEANSKVIKLVAPVLRRLLLRFLAVKLAPV
jgi:hypothetical protein